MNLLSELVKSATLFENLCKLAFLETPPELNKRIQDWYAAKFAFYFRKTILDLQQYKDLLSMANISKRDINRDKEAWSNFFKNKKQVILKFIKSSFNQIIPNIKNFLQNSSETELQFQTKISNKLIPIGIETPDRIDVKITKLEKPNALNAHIVLNNPYTNFLYLSGEYNYDELTSALFNIEEFATEAVNTIINSADNILNEIKTLNKTNNFLDVLNKKYPAEDDLHDTTFNLSKSDFAGWRYQDILNDNLKYKLSLKFTIGPSTKDKEFKTEHFGYAKVNPTYGEIAVGFPIISKLINDNSFSYGIEHDFDRHLQYIKEVVSHELIHLCQKLSAYNAQEKEVKPTKLESSLDPKFQEAVNEFKNNNSTVQDFINNNEYLNSLKERANLIAGGDYERKVLEHFKQLAKRQRSEFDSINQAKERCLKQIKDQNIQPSNVEDFINSFVGLTTKDNNYLDPFFSKLLTLRPESEKDETFYYDCAANLIKNVKKTIRNKNDFGLPSRKLKTKEFDFHGMNEYEKRTQEHELREVEFYSRVQDSINGFKQWLNEHNLNLKNEYAQEAIIKRINQISYVDSNFKALSNLISKLELEGADPQKIKHAELVYKTMFRKFLKEISMIPGMKEIVEKIP